MHCCKLESKLRVDLKPSHHKQINKQTQKESKKTELTMWCDGCINDLDLGNHSTMKHVCQMNTVCYKCMQSYQSIIF